MDGSTSLPIPDSSLPGPSRQHGTTRAVSVSVQLNPPATTHPSRKRASHTVVTTQHQHAEEQPGYHDVYSHPAAVAYAAAHPRRSIPKFGPYLLLQTLGEGEFGKVKLGLHSQWGEEVAVKLIRRGHIDTTARMSKVEREIEVLRTLKHPNIVRLYDVIETDKYIGIILEYASGGELFDHILAHRYLKEKDAAKLFSQLISGVWYIHEKKIVHRDLKLENLLLDRHRNVIITDFGFANRFEHRSNDLMQTSCGSPCYAAPELVISEGLYVGSAVDIWSCGVILYAMLAGYLPFDDDPANPDGDNINLLYKYIVNTPLSFPDYISSEARDLLSMMLVPDPNRRADLPAVMAHPWLSAYAINFTKTVEDLEKSAMDQHQMKRLAYQKQMRQAAAAAKNTRSHTDATDGLRGHRQNQAITQPEYLYETSMDHATSASRKAFSTDRDLPSRVPLDDDPFAPAPGLLTLSPVDDDGMDADARARKAKEETPHRSRKGSGPPVKLSPERTRKANRDMRHTIQVEYDDPDGELANMRSPQKPKREAEDGVDAEERGQERSVLQDGQATHKRKKQSHDKPLPTAPGATPRGKDVAQSSQSESPVDSTILPSIEPKENGTFGSVASRHSHRRGLSVGGGFATNTTANQPLANGIDSTPVSDKTVASTHTSPTESVHRRPSTIQPLVSADSAKAESGSKSALLSPGSDVKKGRRTTLTVMVGTLRARSKKSNDTPAREKSVKEKKNTQPDVISSVTEKTSAQLPPTLDPNASRTSFGMGMAASTNKARKVMQWFRSRRSRYPTTAAEDSIDPEPSTPTQGQYNFDVASNKNRQPSPILVVTTPPVDQPRPVRAPNHPQRSASATESSISQPSLTERVRRSINIGGAPSSRAAMRIHHGAVDGTTITTRPPPEVMKRVREVLVEMGIEISLETDFKYRCLRPKRKKASVGLGLRDGGSNGLAAIHMMGSAASNGVDRRGLPVPSHSFGSNTGGMLRGLLMRRQSSQVAASNTSQHSLNAPDEDAPPLATEPPPVNEAVYGDPSHDAGDEVKFSVELTRIEGLNDTFSLDIRRLKGNLRSYKFLYDTVRQRVDLPR